MKLCEFALSLPGGLEGSGLRACGIIEVLGSRVPGCPYIQGGKNA